MTGGKPCGGRDARHGRLLKDREYVTRRESRTCELGVPTKNAGAEAGWSFVASGALAQQGGGKRVGGLVRQRRYFCSVAFSLANRWAYLPRPASCNLSAGTKRNDAELTQ